MGTRNKYGLICLVVALLVLAVGLNGCKKDGGGDPNAAAAGDNPVETSQQQANADPLETAASLFREPPMSVQNIVNAAKTWDPLFRDYWGKIAPDFTLTDVNGNVHKLSNYRGKNVVVVIWRTAGERSKKKEVPELKELRKAYPETELAILTVSNETPEVLKAFAVEQAIDFTVLARTADLPAPFGQVQYAPGSFFIDPQGRFKLAARGFVSAEDAKAIVQAQ